MMMPTSRRQKTQGRSAPTIEQVLGLFERQSKQSL